MREIIQKADDIPILLPPLPDFRSPSLIGSVSDSELALLWILLVDRSPALFIEQDNRVSVATRALHSRRAGRHAGHGKALGVRGGFQQAMNLARRDMTFDGITIHHRSVA